MTNWELIGRGVKLRRLALRRSARSLTAEGGPSNSIWTALEKHHEPVSEMSLSKIAEVLNWPIDFWEQLSNGVDYSQISSDGEVQIHTDDLLAEVLERDPDTYDRLIQEAREALDRLGGS